MKVGEYFTIRNKKNNLTYSRSKLSFMEKLEGLL